MNLIFSILYAPFVFYALQNFELQKVALVLFSFSLLWLISLYKKPLKETIFPLFYFFVSIMAYFINHFYFLKALPLIISVLISIFMFYSYHSKNSFIFIFLDKIKKKVGPKEKEYIQKCTLFWCFISVINISLHLFVLQHNNLNYWLFYSSFLWIFVFLAAALLQVVHRFFYLKKD